MESSGFSPVSLLMIVLFSAFFIFCNWRIFEKAGIDGWKTLVPFYNTYLLFKMTWSSGWFFLLMFLPIVGTVISLITLFRLGEVFDKGLGFKLGLLFLAPIFYGLLAFDDSEYNGCYE